MATTQPQQETSLQLRRTFAATRERVYRAWTDSRQFAQWFGPTSDYNCIVTEMDLRVGGRYSVEMHHKGGNVHRVTGVYDVVKPPEKLVFTWRWLRDDFKDTVVTVEFLEQGNSTEVILTHDRFVTLEDRGKHEEGWTGTMKRLDNFLVSGKA